MSDDKASAILARLDEHDRRFDEQDRTLERIFKQTSKTNGSVRDLQLWRARIEGATSMLSWVQPTLAAVIGGVIVAVVGLLIGIH